MKKRNLIPAIIFSIVTVIAQSLIPILIGLIIDSIINKDYIVTKNLIIINIVLIIVAIIYDYLLNISAKRFAIETSNSIKEKAIKRLMNSKINNLEKSGTTASIIINDSNNIQTGLTALLLSLIPGVITLIMVIIIMLLMNVKISLVILLLTPLSIAITLIIAKRGKKLTDISTKEYNDMTGYVCEQIELKKYIKAEMLEKQKMENYNHLSEKYRKDETNALFYASIINPVTRLINGTVTVIVIIISSMEILKGNMTIGIFQAFLMYSNRYAKPLNEISQVLSQIIQAKTSLESINTIINYEQEETKDNKPTINGNIKFENVYFSYDTKPILKDINFEVLKGQKIAIVGPTGSGKTTIIQILMKFYNINSGAIKIDNNNITDINTNHLRENIKVVLQDCYLNSPKIKEIIKYQTEYSDEYIIELLKKMNIQPQFIGMNDKLQNICDIEDLSSGQKQILEVIRVILTDPKIVILDEATSDVDTLTEKTLEKSINELTSNRTSIIIAHRLSTIVNADKIIVLEDGKINDIGTHKELLKKEGLYKTIYESQF